MRIAIGVVAASRADLRGATRCPRSETWKSGYNRFSSSAESLNRIPAMTEGLPSKHRRAVLQALSRARLAEIRARYELEIGDRRVAGNHVDAIVRARWVDFAEVLGLLAPARLSGRPHREGDRIRDPKLQRT